MFLKEASAPCCVAAGCTLGKKRFVSSIFDAEQALFHCQQLSDELRACYIARADVLWAKPRNRKIKLEDLQALILRRGSKLILAEKSGC